MAIHPDPEIEVWVLRDKWDRIRAFIKGPEGSPYEGRWWSLFVTFPRLYPSAPPTVRFLSVPYHPNVSPEGRVLFSPISENYSAGSTLLDIIQAVRVLLGRPDLNEPLNRPVAEEFTAARDEFNRKARESALANAKDAVMEFPYASGLVTRETEVPKEAGVGAAGVEESLRDWESSLARAKAVIRHHVIPLGLPDDGW
jgi:ubiquitin-protein ligase